jgi:uridine kinase
VVCYARLSKYTERADLERTTTIIGIAGASGAGKSRFAEQLYGRLAERFPAELTAILHEDSYYRRQGDLSLEERACVNYDHPDALEHELLIDHLRALRNGLTIDVPQYDYSIHDRLPVSRPVAPARIVILEGILILHDPAICGLLDLAVFVDVPLDICLSRRLRRDIQQRGRSLDSVLHQYETSVRPMFFHFVEPTRRHADLIVPRGGENVAALAVVYSHLERLLQG